MIVKDGRELMENFFMQNPGWPVRDIEKRSSFSRRTRAAPMRPRRELTFPPFAAQRVGRPAHGERGPPVELWSYRMGIGDVSSASYFLAGLRPGLSEKLKFFIASLSIG